MKWYSFFPYTTLCLKPNNLFNSQHHWHCGLIIQDRSVTHHDGQSFHFSNESNQIKQCHVILIMKHLCCKPNYEIVTSSNETINKTFNLFLNLRNPPGSLLNETNAMEMHTKDASKSFVLDLSKYNENSSLFTYP